MIRQRGRFSRCRRSWSSRSWHCGNHRPGSHPRASKTPGSSARAARCGSVLPCSSAPSYGSCLYFTDAPTEGCSTRRRCTHCRRCWLPCAHFKSYVEESSPHMVLHSSCRGGWKYNTFAHFYLYFCSVYALFRIKDCTFVYHDKSAVFSCFRTKSTQNGKKQAKWGFGAVNTAAARPFFHLHRR